MSQENPKFEVDAGTDPEGGNTSQDGQAAPARAAASADRPRVTQNNSGRVTFDDRGNAVWEWASSTGSFAVDLSTKRLEKLENPTLALVDDDPSPASLVKPKAIKANARAAVVGYSPYDSGLIEKKNAPRRPKNLRRLGEFFKLRAQAARNKRDE